MSWLFVAFVPGLLMLVTFGLERLESSLHCDALKPADVAEFLERAQPSDVGTLARDGMPEALDCIHRRRQQRNEPSIEATRYASLYSRGHVNSRLNPQFQPTRHADSV